MIHMSTAELDLNLVFLLVLHELLRLYETELVFFSKFDLVEWDMCSFLLEVREDWLSRTG